MDSLLQRVAVAKNKHLKKTNKRINYGTAGFRTRADELNHVMFRMGLLAVLRSKVKNATIGVMITASHNPEDDNGLKLVDPMGEMLEAAWEKHATDLANVEDSQIAETLMKLIKEEKIAVSAPANVFVARDTRPSSATLVQAVLDGVEALDSKYQDFGLMSTPQLHFVVRCRNTQEKYGKSTEDGYYEKLSNAFIKLQGNVRKRGDYRPFIRIDAANGVGAEKLRLLKGHLNDTLDIDVVNDGKKGKLNYMCGADYVKLNQRAPEGLQIQPGVRCASFDGDADRIVYFYFDEGGKFHLLDGDKIATLVAGYLATLMAKSGISLNLGLIQTAYANGNSTNYIIRELKVPVACVPTGVKHLHHKAQEFDIGIYFESNGHGTVVFSGHAEESVLNAAGDDSLPNEQRDAAQWLHVLIGLINQTVGDSLSDLLLVETILCAQGWNAETWDKTYKDIPNRQLTVKVKDRTVIQTADAERKAISPPGLQAAIDKLVSKYSSSRSFVRPSGTEDIVRVYAEADTQTNVDRLAQEVGILVFDMAHGIGNRPVPPC